MSNSISLGGEDAAPLVLLTGPVSSIDSLCRHCKASTKNSSSLFLFEGEKIVIEHRLVGVEQIFSFDQSKILFLYFRFEF